MNTKEIQHNGTPIIVNSAFTKKKNIFDREITDTERAKIQSEIVEHLKELNEIGAEFSRVKSGYTARINGVKNEIDNNMSVITSGVVTDERELYIFFSIDGKLKYTVSSDGVTVMQVDKVEELEQLPLTEVVEKEDKPKKKSGKRTNGKQSKSNGDGDFDDITEEPPSW